jgi:ribosomal protein L6P/L9E
MGFKGIRVGRVFIIKLGYSHKISYLKISGICFLYENRQAFKLVSRDCLTLKNVVYNFKELRRMDAYKKKGVYFKGSIFKFKVSTKKAKF